MKEVLLTNKGKVGGVSVIVAGILATVFAFEGGYVNDPRDPGGETNHGITKSVAVAHGYTGSMKDMPKEVAEQIYIEDYIDKPGYNKVIVVSPVVGEKLVDAGVNVGPGRSSRWFQTALNSLNRGGADFPQINVDGKVGAGTVSAYTSLQKKRGNRRACELVIKLIDAQQATHYMSLTNLKQYTPGWVDNRVGSVPLSKCAGE